MRRQGQYLAYIATLLGTYSVSYGEEKVIASPSGHKIETTQKNNNHFIDKTKEKAQKISKKIKDALMSQSLSSSKNNKKEAQDLYDHFFKDFDIRYAKADYKKQDSLRKELNKHRKKLQTAINNLITVIQKEIHDYRQDDSDLNDQLKKETKADDKNRITDKQKRIKSQISELNQDIINCYKDVINYSQKECDVIKKLHDKTNENTTHDDTDDEEDDDQDADDEDADDEGADDQDN